MVTVVVEVIGTQNVNERARRQMLWWWWWLYLLR